LALGVAVEAVVVNQDLALQRKLVVVVEVVEALFNLLSMFRLCRELLIPLQ
jgi:hypothetical protein